MVETVVVFVAVVTAIAIIVLFFIFYFFCHYCFKHGAAPNSTWYMLITLIKLVSYGTVTYCILLLYVCSVKMNIIKTNIKWFRKLMYILGRS